MTNRIKIDLRYVQPNSAFVMPLYADTGELIVESRVPLSKKKLNEICGCYGNIVYFYSEYDGDDGRSSVHYERVLAQAEALVDEIILTQHLSDETYGQTVDVIDSLIDELEHRESQIIALVNHLNGSDDYLRYHLVNVGILSYLFAKKSGRPTRNELRSIVLGAFLLDIGLVKMDDKLRHKEGIFSNEERLLMKRHPQLSYELLKDINGIDPVVLQIVLFHHERYNGKGYYELPYETMPDCVKLVSICDVFDALTSERPYRPALSPQDSMKVLVNLINNQFERRHVSLFVNSIAPQITGGQTFYQCDDMVELNTGELAYICKHAIHDELDPSVRIVGRFKKGADDRPRLSFLSHPVDVNLENDPTRSIRRFIVNLKQIESLRHILVEKKFLELQ